MGWDNHLLKTNNKKQTGTLIKKAYERESDWPKMCSPPWPSSTRLLRQRQVVGHYHCWHHMASCNKGENGRHYHSPAMTNSPSWANGKNYGQTSPSQCPHHSIASQLLAALGVHATLPGSALYGWTGQGSARPHSAQLCLSLGLAFSHGKEEQNGAASAVWWLFIPPEAMLPAMTSCSALSVYQNHPVFFLLWGSIRRKAKQAHT